MIREQGEDLFLDVSVVPGGVRTRIVGVRRGRLTVQLSSRFAGGSGNDELVRFLASTLRVDRVQIEIVGGHASLNKTVRLASIALHLARLRFAPFGS